MTAYRDSIHKSYDLYLFNLLLIREITRFALKEEKRRKGKHIPTEYDQAFSAKLLKSRLVQSLIKNEAFNQALKRRRLADLVAEDRIQPIYSEFSKTDEYRAYIQQEKSTPNDHLAMLLFLFKFSVTGDLYNDVMDDYFGNWWDDKSLVIGAVKKTLKALPLDDGYINRIQPGHDTVTEFGEALLLDVQGNDTKLLEYIEPTLNNWDAERVAIIDMILLKMAISEMLHFPTIPTKVTLNEFVEIAKMYSSDKSKDFINGILDRLLKQLNEEGAIVKEGRGLV